MANTVNQFFKGLDTDSDNTKIHQASVRVNKGWRVIETSGKGYINSLIPGTEYSAIPGAEVGFKLSAGFKALGRATYLGISYVVSYNPNTGETEFGTFPSPKLNSVGYDNVYRPLKNYLGLTNPYAAQALFPNNDVAYLAFLQAFEQDFKVALNMDGQHPVRVEVRLEYDNSVNIYFCDGKNPLRVINSGFNCYTGMRTKKAFYVEMLDHAINVLNETDQPARLLHDPGNGVEEVEIGYNGRFKCGNVIFYFRYSDMDFNATSFLSNSGAVSIIPSNEQLDNEPQSFCGGPEDKETNKSVKLNFEVGKLDTSYKYLEIAYVRHTNAGTFETKLIAKRWEIINMITNSVNGAYQIEITDTEDKKPISKEEIKSIKRTDDIPVDLKIFEDRLFIGNLKAYDEAALYTDLLQFAKDITCAADVSHTMVCKPAHEASTVNEIGYKYYKNVYHYAHYASGEAYQFGVQYLIKKTGKWTESFPIQGRDDINGVGTGATNANGIYRFPKNTIIPLASSQDNMTIKGIKFTYPAIPATITNDIAAIRFTRAERKKNLLYQGVICKAFGSHSDPAWGRYANHMSTYGATFNVEPFAFHYNDPAGFVVDLQKKRTDGRAYIFYSSTRAFPTPFTFNPAIADVDIGVWDLVQRPTPDLWRDPYSWDGGNCCIPNEALNASLGWLRARVPWYLHINDNHGHLHHENAHWQSAANRANFAGTISNSKKYSGISFKGDYGNYHEGISYIIPGWQKGYWGIYSLDYAITETLNEASYFIEKVGQADNAATTILQGAYNTAGDSGSETNCLVQYMMDFKLWEFNPAIWTKPYCAAAGTDVVFKGACYKIGQWNVYPNQIFASYFMEGSGEKYDVDFKDDDADGEEDALSGQNLEIQRTPADFHFYYFHQKNRAKNEGLLEIKNMEFGVAPYIGVDFTSLAQSNTYLEGTPKFWHKELVNVYMVNPASLNVEDWYNFSNEFFFPISQHIYVNEIVAGNTKTCYRGDCFPQHAYIRVVANPKYNPHARDDDYAGFVARGLAEAKFGHLMGYVGEHFNNVGLRHPATYEQSRVTEEYDVETFYPTISPLKPEEYAQYNRARESFRYNTGYNTQLSWAVSSGYDISLPYRRKEYPCRIAFSGRHIAGEITDSFREFKLTSHRDYESHTGALTGLAAKNGKFYSIYQNGIRMHYVNELQQVQSTAGAIIIGTQTDVLHEKAIVLTDSVGSQHTQGIIETDSLVTGIDYNKRMIWSVVAASGEFHMASIEKSINSDVQSLIDSINHISDIRIELADTPSSDTFEGISVGYNRKFKEIWYSINKPSFGIQKTWIYSEKLGQFTGTLPLHIPMYVTINEDFYGIDYANNLIGDTYFHLMDVAVTSIGLNNHQYFFGQEIDAEIKLVVNQSAGVDKIFDALWLHMNQESLLKIDYATMYQSGSHNPFNTNATPLYIRPRYSENKWQVPIKRCDVASSHYQVGSAYRGKWLEISLTVDASLTGRRLVFLESVETFLRQTMN